MILLNAPKMSVEPKHFQSLSLSANGAALRSWIYAYSFDHLHLENFETSDIEIICPLLRSKNNICVTFSFTHEQNTTELQKGILSPVEQLERYEFEAVCLLSGAEI